MSNLKTKDLVLSALFIALITVGTFIRIPMGSDVYTLQFLFTLLAGLVLGEKLGTFAVDVTRQAFGCEKYFCNGYRYRCWKNFCNGFNNKKTARRRNFGRIL